MPRTAKPHAVSLPDARRIWLAAQRLDTEAPFGDGPGGDAGRGRASRLRPDRHHQRHRALPPPHPLHPHPGLPPRRPPPCAGGREVGVRVLDPRAVLHPDPGPPLLRRRHAPPPPRGPCLVRLGLRRPTSRKVMRLLRDGGPLSIRDIDDDVLVDKNHPWASRKPSKAALQFAFFMGRVAVSERSGMLKTYDLIDRHFGWETAAEAGLGARHRRLSPRPRAPLPGRRQPRFDHLRRRLVEAGDAQR